MDKPVSLKLELSEMFLSLELDFIIFRNLKTHIKITLNY